MTTAPAWRDADWRFLLDDIDAGAIATAGDPAGDPAGELGTRVVVCADPTDGALDSAIAATADVDDAPVVVQTTTRRRARRVRRVLAQRGFEVRAYGCWPSCAAPTLFVDLDRRKAMSAAVGTVKNVHRRRVGRIAVRLGIGRALFGHTTIVARRSSAVVPLPVQVAFGDAARDAALALLTPRFGSSRHVIALVTDVMGERRVVKTPRVPSDDVQIAREAAGLSSVANHRDGAPRLISDTSSHGHRWIVQSHVDGRPLTRGDVRRDPVDWIVRCRAWLAAMPTAPATAPGADGRVERLLTPALARVAALTDHADDRATDRATDPAVERLVADAEHAIAVLRDLPLPVVAEHGDFRPPNVIVTPSSGVAAVDWELAEPHGLPLHDLAFLHAYVVDVAPDRRATLDAVVDDAARALGIDPAVVDALYVAMLLRQLANSSVRGIAGGSRAWQDVDVARAWIDRIRRRGTEGG